MGRCLTQRPVSSYAGVLSSLPTLPHRGGSYGAERIVKPKPPKARPGRYSESRRHQRNDPPSISPDLTEFSCAHAAVYRHSFIGTAIWSPFPAYFCQHARTRAQVHPPLRSGFFMPSHLMCAGRNPSTYSKELGPCHATLYSTIFRTRTRASLRFLRIFRQYFRHL